MCAGVLGLTADGHQVERFFFWVRSGDYQSPGADAEQGACSGAAALAGALSHCIMGAALAAGQCPGESALERHVLAQRAAVVGAVSGHGQGVPHASCCAMHGGWQGQQLSTAILFLMQFASLTVVCLSVPCMPELAELGGPASSCR